jgi:glutamate formiminotransferase
MNHIIECVPNFSEGRDPLKVERIVEAFRGHEDVRLLDYSCDEDHNRLVVTVIGTPEAVGRAVIEAVGAAVREIDLREHRGQHPRLGAVDVIPFIPIENLTINEADTLAQTVGKAIADRYALPVYLYERSASADHRRNLAEVRKGEFEGLGEKMKRPEWAPDFGPAVPHPTAGATAVGARLPLIAFNINLNTNDIEIARSIARKVRFSSGGLPACKAMGVFLHSRETAQVSMNLTDYTQTSIYEAVERVRLEAQAHGVSVAGCELIGLLPLQAVTDSFARYLNLENFSVRQLLDTHF